MSSSSCSLMQTSQDVSTQLGHNALRLHIPSASVKLFAEKPRSSALLIKPAVREKWLEEGREDKEQAILKFGCLLPYSTLLLQTVHLAQRVDHHFSDPQVLSCCHL